MNLNPFWVGGRENFSQLSRWCASLDDRMQNDISRNAGLNFPEMQSPNWLNKQSIYLKWMPQPSNQNATQDRFPADKSVY